jgi:hypothetical protein
MPVSLMTIGSVADLGYAVNYGAAEPYAVPPAGLMAAPHAEPHVSFHGDVVIEPFLIQLPDGSVELVEP